MTRHALRAFLVVLACCVSLAQASELTQYRYDFEYDAGDGYYALGSSPHPTYTWSGNINYRSIITNEQAYAGTQSAVVRGTASEAKGCMERVSFAPSADGKDILSIAMYVSDKYNGLDTAYCAGLYAISTQTADPLTLGYPLGVTVTQTSAGVTTLKWTNGSATPKSQTIDPTLFEDKWVVIEIRLDDQNNKYGFTIWNADKTTALVAKEDLSFAPGTHTVDKVAFYTEKNAADRPVQVYYDNLSVVPEPMTVSLLAAGMSLLALKRRHVQ